MPDLELTYESQDAIPDAYKDLYTERDGAFVLTGINGIKTQKDVQNVQEALRKERTDHSAAKAALAPWKKLGESPEEVQEKLDRIAELELAAGGKLDESKLQEMVDARLAQKTGPLERQIRELTEASAAKDETIQSLQGNLVSRDRNDVIRAAATEMKILPTAIADVELLAGNHLEFDETSGSFITKEGIKGVTPGVDAKQYLKDMQKSRPHWWPASEGGGAGGGKGGFASSDENPWSAAGWSLTRQGQYLREHGEAKAQEAAKAAGTKLGGLRPSAKK